jgi:hypothetical protein
MLETAIVAALLFLLIAVSWMSVLLSWYTIIIAGAVVVAFGLCVGLPTSLYYHVRLHRTLHPRGQLPRGWWWHPMRYHDLLEPAERTFILLWFYAGAVSFGLIVLGFAMAGLGLLLESRSSG